MPFLYADDLTASDMAEVMMEQFGRENCRLMKTDSRVVLGEKTYGGTSNHVRLAGQQMSSGPFRVSNANGRTRLRVLQDVLDDTSQPSRESGLLHELLKTSF